MKILTAPHELLRKAAEPIVAIDKKIIKLTTELGDTLVQKDDPPGVGLAGPQVGVSKRFFATYLPLKDAPELEEANAPSVLRIIFNPKVTDVSEKLVFGPTKQEQRLEGCLSIPGIYGPVPRFSWVEYQFEELENGELSTRQERFSDFPARVMQHEYDHLEGILFTDYSLQHDLPVFRENPRTKELEEIDKSLIELL